MLNLVIVQGCEHNKMSADNVKSEHHQTANNYISHQNSSGLYVKGIEFDSFGLFTTVTVGHRFHIGENLLN